MAGYVLGSEIKALICARAGEVYLERWAARYEQATGRRPEVRGSRGHDLESLVKYARINAAIQSDPILRREFAITNRWSVDLRYEVRAPEREYAARFLEAVETLRAWLREQV